MAGITALNKNGRYAFGGGGSYVSGSGAGKYQGGSGAPGSAEAGKGGGGSRYEGGGGYKSPRNPTGTLTGADYDRSRREFNQKLARDNANRNITKTKTKTKTNPFKKTFDAAYDFGKNYLTNRQKNLYNIVPNNPKRELEFLSSLQITDPKRYDSLPQNLKDVLENTQFDFSGSFKDQDKLSYDDFKSLTEFDDGAFATYAKNRGSPGLSVAGDMNKVGIKSIRRDKIT